jgi:hypothetical protein
LNDQPAGGEGAGSGDGSDGGGGGEGGGGNGADPHPNDPAPKPGQKTVAWPKLHPDALHGLAGEIIRTIEPHTEADPAAMLLQYLSSFGNIIGRSAHFHIAAVDHYAVLHTLVVGESAISRKGTSAQEIRRVFLIADQSWCFNNVNSGTSSGEGIIEPIRDARYVMKKGQEELTDPGVADKRLYLDEREFSSVLDSVKREGNVAGRVLREAWDCVLVLRTLTKHTKSKATLPHVSMSGHITQYELLQKMDLNTAMNGFGNRLLYCCSRSTKSLPRGGNLTAEQLSKLAAKTKERIEFASMVGRIGMTDASWSMWDNVYEELKNKKRPSEMLAGLCSRAPPQTLRLAMIYALLDGKTEIDCAHLRAGLAVWNYCENSACYIWSDSSLGNSLADTIYRHLLVADAKGMTRTEIYNKFGCNIPSGKITAALDALATSGMARFVKEMKQLLGRPIERWFAI